MWNYLYTFSCNLTPIDKTIQKKFYKINISYLSTPIDTQMEKYLYRIKFSFPCTPIDVI